MNTNEAKTTVYLSWYTSEYDKGSFHLSFQNFGGSPGSNFTPLCEVQVEWPDVEFDATGPLVKMLEHKMGEAQAQVNFFKEEIAKLLCISHEAPAMEIPDAVEVVVCNWPDANCTCSMCAPDL